MMVKIDKKAISTKKKNILDKKVSNFLKNRPIVCKKKKKNGLILGPIPKISQNNYFFKNQLLVRVQT
jgi:hypothetical protein